MFRSTIRLLAFAVAATMLLASVAHAADTVKVFILAGQSNMEGKAPNALFDHQATDAKTKDFFAHLRDGDQWEVRDDVFIKFLNRKGPLRFQALEQGLVSKVVPAEELIDAARAKAEKLARMAPHYVRSVKNLAWQSLDNSLADHLQLERHGIADSMGTEDLRNGVTAFFAGEEVTFEGR